MGRSIALSLGLLALVAGAAGATSGKRIQLAVSIVGPGHVTSRPAGISCPSRCRAFFTAGTRVVLTAQPAAGAGFRTWRGGCAAAARCTLLLRASRRVTAVFARPAAAAPAQVVGPTEAVARAPVDLLATDGGRVAFVACARVVVWIPAERRAVQIDGSDAAACVPPTGIPPNLVALAIAGDRVASLEHLVGNSPVWILRGGSLAAPGMMQVLLTSGGRCCAGTPLKGILGNLRGAGGLLVFTSADTDWPAGVCCTPPLIVREQRIQRVEPAGCPCPVIETQPGPIVPFDVEGGRILAGGDNATLVLGADGSDLQTIPVPALGGGLAGNDVVLLGRASSATTARTAARCVRRGRYRRRRRCACRTPRAGSSPTAPTGNCTCFACATAPTQSSPRRSSRASSTPASSTRAARRCGSSRSRRCRSGEPEVRPLVDRRRRPHDVHTRRREALERGLCFRGVVDDTRHAHR